MIKAYKFKLYRSHKNKKLQRQLEIACHVWNHCIAIHRMYYKLFHKSLNKYALSRHLTKLKHTDRYAHWNDIMFGCITDIIERIDLSYQAFYRNIKQKKKASTPHFIRRKDYKSITYRKPGNKFMKDGRVRLNKVWYKYFDYREIEGEAKMVTISKDTIGDYWVVVTCEVPDPTPVEDIANRPVVGLDFGLKHFLISSDGLSDIDSPTYLFEGLDQLRKKSRKHSLKKNGSTNQERSRLELARLHKKIHNKRDFFQWAIAKRLVHRYSVICIEDLNIQGMQKRWGRKIGDLAFSSFVEKLEYLAKVEGITVVKVGKFFPSSQLCHHCGYKCEDTKDLKIREWTCPNCGKTLDRDRNAAINILNEGLRVLNNK